MSEKIFENYESAHAHSLTVPWELKLCNTGESCWCRIIVPVEPIKYKRNISIDLLIKSSEIIDEIDYIIPDGCIDKETAEYFLELHHNHLKFNQIVKDNIDTKVKITTHVELRCNNCYRTVGSYFYRNFCKFCYDKGVR